MPYADPEKRKQYHRDYYREYMRRWAREHPKENVAHVRRWREENPEALLAQLHRRKAAKTGAQGTHTGAERKALFIEYGGRCAYCPARATSLDHVIPLSQGGSNAIDNCVPACKSCNSSKGRKTLLFWLAVRASVMPCSRS